MGKKIIKVIRWYCELMIGNCLYGDQNLRELSFWTTEDDTAQLKQINIITIWFKVLLARLSKKYARGY